MQMRLNTPVSLNCLSLGAPALSLLLTTSAGRRVVVAAAQQNASLQWYNVRNRDNLIQVLDLLKFATSSLEKIQLAPRGVGSSTVTKRDRNWYECATLHHDSQP